MQAKRNRPAVTQLAGGYQLWSRAPSRESPLDGRSTASKRIVTDRAALPRTRLARQKDKRSLKGKVPMMDRRPADQRGLPSDSRDEHGVGRSQKPHEGHPYRNPSYTISPRAICNFRMARGTISPAGADSARR